MALGCCSKRIVRDVILDERELVKSGSTVQRSDESSPIGVARIRSSAESIPIVKVKRCGGSWLNPRIYMFGADGSLVGSAVYRRVASLALGGEACWVFDRPLCAVKRRESGTLVQPVDSDVLKALHMCVR